jgi:acyl-phosphate glycerol 3-phosphate acyltransferase
MALDLFSIAFAFCIGSVLWGVVIGRVFFGRDPRQTDNPGASGCFRQFGRLAGFSVGVLDLAKGASAVWLAQHIGASEFGVSISAAAVVAGHNWPIWLGFSGGGGLATVVGSIGYVAPRETLIAVFVSLTVALLFKISPLYGRFPIYPLPAGAVAGVPTLIGLTLWSANHVATYAICLSGLAIGLRALQMLRQSRHRSHA